MIDLSQEQLITFRQAATLLPKQRAGRPVHVSSIFRWATKGCRGIRLEFIQAPGAKYTSREALARFFQRLSGEQPHDSAAMRTPAQRQRDTARADADLRKAGL